MRLPESTKSNYFMQVTRKREKHGMHSTPIYKLWQSMLHRCRNPNSPAFKWYGGRGISVCERWYSFISFYEDMGDRPPGMELDRIDNGGSYSKENCRWVSHSENCKNRRRYPEKRPFFPRKHNESTLSSEIGKSYGRWVVVETLQRQYQHIKVLCRCECGKEQEVALCTLKNGDSTQCLTCGTRQAGAARAKYKVVDFKEGDVYGSWKCIGGNEMRHRMIHIKCECKCGNQVFVSARSLKNGRSSQCTICSRTQKGCSKSPSLPVPFPVEAAF